MRAVVNILVCACVCTPSAASPDSGGTSGEVNMYLALVKLAWDVKQCIVQ